MILPERVLGSASAKRISSGRASAPICSTTCSRNSFANASSAVTPTARGHERDDGLALEVVRPADHRGLGDLRVRDQRALDFHRRQAMAGDVDHVVDAPHDPEVAVLVLARAVAGEVAAGDLAEVRLHEALVVAEDRAQHRRPRPLDHEEAALVRPRTACHPCPRRRRRCRGTGASPSPAWSASRPAAARS